MLVDRIIDRAGDISSVSRNITKLNRLLKSSTSSMEEVSSLIEKDPAFSSRVLRIANSSYYGLASKVDSIERAVVVLGFNTVCNLVMTVGAFNFFRVTDRKTEIDFEKLWYHNLGCAVATNVLMKRINQAEAEKAFMCGILHDIGKAVMAQAVPNEQIKILEILKNDTSKTLLEAEEEVLKTTHAEIGYAIAKKWHFPEDIIGAIRNHHTPSGAGNFRELAYAVHLGNAFAKALAFGRSTEPRVTVIEPFAWECFWIKKPDIPAIITAVQDDFDLALESWMAE
jgi:putative nucleotidyltransferase with HDIG domain